MSDRAATVRALLEQHGRSFAEEAGITLEDKPMPLYQLLVLATLLSARISADIAVAAATELFRAGCRTPERMLAASWQDRVDALGRGHYKRYDESTATRLGDGAQLCLDRWQGDLRRLHEDGGQDRERLASALQEFPGIGPAGAEIFLREVQDVWGLPFLVDPKMADGAEALDLPTDPEQLTDGLTGPQLPRLAAALVRAQLQHLAPGDLTGS